MDLRKAADEEEDKLDGDYQALRQTPNAKRGLGWKRQHRAVREELERVWDTLRDHVRVLDRALTDKMDDWDVRHREVSDNILVAGHVLEAMTRHRDFEQQALRQSQESAEAFGDGVQSGAPRARFNAWWLRA